MSFGLSKTRAFVFFGFRFWFSFFWFTGNLNLMNTFNFCQYRQLLPYFYPFSRHVSISPFRIIIDGGIEGNVDFFLQICNVGFHICCWKFLLRLSSMSINARLPADDRTFTFCWYSQLELLPKLRWIVSQVHFLKYFATLIKKISQILSTDSNFSQPSWLAS